MRFPLRVKPMVRVHHLENSRSHRILWLLEELGQPYEVVRYARDPATLLAPPELRRLHPLGKSPLVELHGAILAESGAIIETLAERFDAGHRISPPPQPLDAEERVRYRYGLHYAEGSAMPPLLLSLVFARLRKAPMPFFVKPVARGIADKALATFVGPQLALHLDFMEDALARRPWFAGERFTAADIQMSFPVEAAARRAGDRARPNLTDFLDRIHARPAYRAALARGGGFDIPA